MNKCLSLAVCAAALSFAVASPARPQATRPGGLDVFPYTQATAVRGCTAAGAPVLQVFFTRTPLADPSQPAPPYLRLELSSAPEETIPAGPYALSPQSPTAEAPASGERAGHAFLAVAGQPPVEIRGTLDINSMEPGRFLNGHFRVEMPDGKIAESGFLARYAGSKPACGA